MVTESPAPPGRIAERRENPPPGAALWEMDRSLIAILSAVAIAAYLLLHFSFDSPRAAEAVLLLALAAGGLPILAGLARALLARHFDTDLLAGISILTAVLVHEYLVAAIILLMVSGGAALEGYATRRASSTLAALTRRSPRTAHRKRQESIEDVALDQVRKDDELLIFPHEICPVDGVVVEGSGTMDEAYLTGEPYLISKTCGALVYSGAINGEGALTIRATAIASDSRYAQIVRILRQAEGDRPQMRRLADRLGAWYTPAALALAALAWLLSGQPERFLSVLVIATPCPLLLAVPVAVIGSISLAARRSIIIKNAGLLERIDQCRTVILDKTGTVTYGTPRVTGIVTLEGFTEDEVVAAAAALERYSRHPLAAAVLEFARNRSLPPATVSDIAEKSGEGLAGTVDGRRVRITGRYKLGEGATELPIPQPGMECVILIEDFIAGLLYFRDEPRPDSRTFIQHLRPRHAIQKLVLLSGDPSDEVAAVAAQLGIVEVYAGASPEFKLEVVRRHTLLAPTLFVGDGINDAPAMQAATAAVALGKENEVAGEAADAVILEPSLAKVDELMHIGRRLRRIALQSAGGGMVLSAAGMMVAAAGFLPPLTGAILQEAIDLAAVLNALRAAFPPRVLSDY